MCQLCLDAVNEHLPWMSWEAKQDVLWNHTAFPFASGERTAEQVKEWADAIMQSDDDGLSLYDPPDPF